jgi:hypothetical protein
MMLHSWVFFLFVVSLGVFELIAIVCESFNAHDVNAGTADITTAASSDTVPAPAVIVVTDAWIESPTLVLSAGLCIGGSGIGPPVLEGFPKDPAGMYEPSTSNSNIKNIFNNAYCLVEVYVAADIPAQVKVLISPVLLFFFSLLI